MISKHTTAKSKSIPLSGTVLVVALLVVSIVLATVYAREGQDGPLHRVQSVAGMVTAPLQFAGAGVAYAADTAGDAVENATVSNESYTALQQENAQLRDQLVQMEELRQENERLTALLDIQSQYQIDGATGRVIGTGSDAYSRDITVNVGSNSGVEPGQAVVGPSGLVGQVTEVSPLTCRVRLITDPQSGVSAYLQSSRDQCVVKGAVDGLLYLEYLDDAVQVKVGDVVVTSGMGGSFPAGITIGTVTNVVNQAGTSDRTVIVSPLSTADALEEVTVVFSSSAGDAAAGDSSDGQDAGDASASDDAGVSDDASDGTDGTDAAYDEYYDESGEGE
ncbi:rod shape-determining protein MreC [uncultured Slackia sp.]|uniref:rod shape-determining protein MreC n=1 Tax=uncultured Slackia sp. TaxID=665903 RepID=UPI0025DB3E93|nr:rod shape-determining protein MreC [uncultured Slackia sp.]